MLCRIFLIFVAFLINVSYCSFWLVWPMGISWWGWRYHIGLGVLYTGFNVEYLYEWSNCDTPTNNYFRTWSCASYEEPRFYREISSFVPSYLRQNCDENGIDLRFLHYFSTREDQKRNNTVLKTLGGTVYYDNSYYHNYLAFLFNICNCLRGNTISQTCPDPCRRPGICSLEKNVVRGSCRKEPNKNIQLKLVDGPFKNIFGHLYLFESVCKCKMSYVWNKKTRLCDRVTSACSLEKIGSQVCQNGGKCVPTSTSERMYDFLILRCICPPAWSGYLCTEPINPCKRSRRLCSSFACKRDSTSITKGYYCVCTKGFQRYSQFEPRCVNINECNKLPCQHGGTCKDLTPDPLKPGSLPYNCSCINGFSGNDCEVPPRSPEWSEWSSWTSCSRSCGLGGVMTRSRFCSGGMNTKAGGGQCAGLAKQTASCVSNSMVCEELGLSIGGDKKKGDNEGDSDDQQSFLRKFGVGWDPEEDRIIDDAFHWNERLISEKSENTIYLMTKLRTTITALLITLLSLFCLLILFNLGYVGPRQWLPLTWKSFVARSTFGNVLTKTPDGQLRNLEAVKREKEQLKLYEKKMKQKPDPKKPTKKRKTLTLSLLRSSKKGSKIKTDENKKQSQMSVGSVRESVTTDEGKEN